MTVAISSAWRTGRVFLGWLLWLGLLVGCTAVPAFVEPSPLPEPTLTSTAAPLPAVTDTAEQPASGPLTLSVWVPPQFDPADGSAAGQLLPARLDEFAARRSGVRITVRVKEVEGPGGMLDTLSTASAAAPLALPDLIALPRATLETASIKGLLHSFDGLSTTMDDPDWYSYARELAHLQGLVFGMPFAGDALMLTYRPATIPLPPLNWTESLSLTATMAFPAAEPRALYTVALYQSAGGELLDENGRPSLDPLALTEVFTYYHQAAATSLLPFWLTQYDSADQSWQAYNDQQLDLSINWTSDYLQAPPLESNGALIPTYSGEPFTLATGWVWALASPDPERQAISAELAEFLTNSDFISAWSAAAGYLPTRPSALAEWQNRPLQNLMSQIAVAAQMIPPQDVLTTVGPILQQATVDILKAQTDPLQAAEAAASKLTNP